MRSLLLIATVSLSCKLAPQQQDGKLKAFSRDKAVPASSHGRVIYAHMTMRDRDAKLETDVYLKITADEDGIPTTVAFSQLDAEGNPDPCPDSYDANHIDHLRIPESNFISITGHPYDDHISSFGISIDIERGKWKVTRAYIATSSAEYFRTTQIHKLPRSDELAIRKAFENISPSCNTI